MWLTDSYGRQDVWGDGTGRGPEIAAAGESTPSVPKDGVKGALKHKES